MKENYNGELYDVYYRDGNEEEMLFGGWIRGKSILLDAGQFKMYL